VIYVHEYVNIVKPLKFNNVLNK